ncbi:MAG: bifunctional diaminohydroxyphosphoribosylaminopyrimidine deaminase/5-amino-6-(5-phosphoribosylamino)uracil reductase RibD [Chitinophagaceae bacterium]
MATDELLMRRCFQLALLGSGSTAPNPLVGAVLAHGDRIIGEGYHQLWGQAHAEVNCLSAVSKSDQTLVAKSRLFVSLEPCAHQGKTPPCTELIIRHQIPEVIIGCLDPFTAVNGKGREALQAAGVKVHLSTLVREAQELNKRFFTFHLHQRPYIILKWAESADGFLSRKADERMKISSELSDRTVHHWRQEEAAILIGTNTARIDNPQLTNRLWPGKSPVRLVLDRNATLPANLNLFKDHPTIVFTTQPGRTEGSCTWIEINVKNFDLPAVVRKCHEMQLQSILVEGGQQLLSSFLQQNLWDEIRVITNTQLTLHKGYPSPLLPAALQAYSTEQIGPDMIRYFRNLSPVSYGS